MFLPASREQEGARLPRMPASFRVLISSLPALMGFRPRRRMAERICTRMACSEEPLSLYLRLAVCRREKCVNM